jgi:hypothetical protein
MAQESEAAAEKALLILLCVAGALLLGTLIAHKCLPGDWAPIAALIFNFSDLISDGIFAYTLHAQNSVFFSACVTFIFLPIICNTLITMWLLRRMLQSSENRAAFNAYVDKYALTVSVVCFFSTGGTESLRILKSKILDLGMFDAPVSRAEELLILSSSLTHFLIEDIPQIVIAILVLAADEKANYVAAMSIIVSLASLLFGIINRSVFCCLLNGYSESSAEEQKRESSADSYLENNSHKSVAKDSFSMKSSLQHHSTSSLQIA